MAWREEARPCFMVSRPQISNRVWPIADHLTGTARGRRLRAAVLVVLGLVVFAVVLSRLSHA